MAFSAVAALTSTATVALTTGVAGAIGGTYLMHFAVTFALGAAMKALTPKPSAVGGNRGYQTNSLGPAQDHQIIYGKVKVGGAIIFDESTGDNNKFLHRVIAVSGHEIDSFDDVYIDDQIVTLNSDGFVTAPSKYVKTVVTQVQTGVDIDGRPIYSPSTTTSYYIRVNKHLGASDQIADADLVSESTKWTDNHRLRGVAYLYVRLKFDGDLFPNGVPTFTTTVKGKKVYNPSDSSTAWSDNPALCIRDYLTSKYGLDEDTYNIDDTLVSSSVTVCNQTNTISGNTRYTCNGAFTTGSTPYDTLNEMLKSMGGSLWYAQGKWRMKPAYWVNPVMDLNEDDLRSSMSVSTRHSRRDNFNVVKGTFRGLESNWQTTDYPQVTNSSFLEADNGQESVADVDLLFTDNSIEARRLALISLESNRQQLTVNCNFGIRTLQLQVGDNIRLSNTRFGWSNKEFEVVQWSFGLTDGLDLQTELTLRETASSVFDEVSDGIVYERDNTELLSPFLVPSVGLSSSVVARVFAEKLVNEMTLTVTSAASERIDHVEVQYRDSGETEYKSVGTGDLGKFIISDLEKSFYDARARAINTFGIYGEYEYLFNLEVDALSAPPADITNFGHELSGGSLFLQWSAVADLDLSYYTIKHSPLTVGATWGSSNAVIQKVARPATNSSLPARSGTFLIKAYDKNLNESVNATSLAVLPSELPPLGTSQELVDNPNFLGVKTNCIVVSSKLEIDDTTSATPTAEYALAGQGSAPYLDTGSSRSVRATGSVVFERKFDGGTMLWDDIPQQWDTWVGNWDKWTDESAQFSDVSAIVYVSATSDDPSGSPVWGAYALANGADVVGRAFRFKVLLNSTNAKFTPSIINLSGKVEY